MSRKIWEKFLLVTALALYIGAYVIQEPFPEDIKAVSNILLGCGMLFGALVVFLKWLRSIEGKR